MEYKTFSFNPFQTTCTLLASDGECVVVDPGCYDDRERQALFGAVRESGCTPVAIWLTHGHFDHIYGVSAFLAEFSSAAGDIPVYMSGGDEPLIRAAASMAGVFGLDAPDVSFRTRDFPGGGTLAVGKSVFEVIPTPGHSPGGSCFLCREAKILLSGDTLFAGAIGRTDLPLGDYDKLIVSLMDSLMGLDGDIFVIPGHGPCTDIGYERTHNPFLQPFNEKEDMDEGSLDFLMN